MEHHQIGSSFWQDESKHRQSKYVVATRRLNIPDKMLSDWIAQEDKIWGMRKGQQNDSKGRSPTLSTPKARKGIRVRITVAIDGSEDSKINIRGSDNYSVPMLKDNRLDSMDSLQSVLQLDMDQVDAYASNHDSSNTDSRATLMLDLIAIPLRKR